MAVFTAIGTALGVSASLWGGAAAFGTGLAVAGGAAYGAYALGKAATGGKGGGFGMQMPMSPKAPKMEDASKMAQLRNEERKRAMSRSKSVISNPLGLKDEAATVRKKLLGG
jgi:hypothetical protein